jgi:putative transcriptional regulator
MKNLLKVYRAMQNMTQEELAEKAHVTRQTIISIESGKYEPSIQLAFKLSKIFQVQIEDLFIYEE